MIYYIGHYADKTMIKKRHVYLSAVNKMEYIINVIDNLGYQQKIISCSVSSQKSSDKANDINIGLNSSVHYFKTYGRKNIFTKLIDYIFLPLRLFFYIVNNISYNDKVIVYHSTYYSKIIKLTKKIKKFNLILEVEEIYADVEEKNKKRKKELKNLLSADQYIFPTKLLSEVVNVKNKPEIIVHGTYKVETQKISKLKYRQLHNWDNDKYHIVYAGTFDHRKGGCISAIESVAFLPCNYHMHILGFGSNEEVQRIKVLIKNIQKKSKATITYDGLLSGEDYIEFIQSCDIGLSTQTPTAAFNATSFPSKILSYLSNGLRVVSIRILAVEKSDVNVYVNYYDEQVPEQIAKAIISVNLQSTYDSRTYITKLSKEFEQNLLKLLKN